MTHRSETATVTVPARVWGLLANEAEERGTRVDDLVVAAIRNVLWRSHRQAVVIGLALLGHTDKAIAELTGESHEFIREARHSVGISAKTIERRAS